MDMEKLKKEMLDKKIWAVVGATPNEDKFGYKIYKKLKNRGYEVYAVNPRYDEVDSDKCYHSLSDLPVKPNCVDMVVPPQVTNKTLEEIKANNIEYVWFQPGTFTEKTINLADEKGLKSVYYDCVLVALG